MMFRILIWVTVALSASFAGYSQKIDGVSFVGPPKEVGANAFAPIHELAADYVAIIPFAYGNSGSSDLVWRDLNWQWWGESPEGARECIRMAHLQGIKTMLKPQVWFDRGSFTGDFELGSEGEWQKFESKYRQYILEYARMAEEESSELLCIGTELCAFAEKRPQFWQLLISDVKKVYKGKVTYASNWDSYTRVSFWKGLDFIGIDAYFPVCTQETPSIKSVLIGWEPHFRKMKQFAERHGKAVLFTEFGYRSSDYCCREPWDYREDREVNLQAQVNAYEGMFRKFWTEDWFAGGFLWKWFADHSRAGGQSNNNFTPQNKPAESLIREFYRRY